MNRPLSLIAKNDRRHFLGHLLLSSGALGLCEQVRSNLLMDQLTVCGCSLPNFTFVEMLEKLLRLGFSGVEIAAFADDAKTDAPDTYPWAVVNRLSVAERDRAKGIASQFKHISTHLPYGVTMRPIASSASIREQSRLELFRSLEDSSFWNSELANVHVFSEKELAFSDCKADLIQLYRDLGDDAKERGIRLAIETTRPFSGAEYLELIRDIDHENVGGCVDTGHIHFFEKELSVPRAERRTSAAIDRYNNLLIGIAKELGSKLFHLHLDDVRSADWREHFVVGQGIVDWRRLFHHLSEVRYDRLMALELLYYDGASDDEPNLKRAFKQRTRDGSAENGLIESRSYISSLL